MTGAPADHAEEHVQIPDEIPIEGHGSIPVEVLQRLLLLEARVPETQR